MAPDLSDIIREGLQRKQVSPENIENNLRHIKSLPTYNRAFQALWHFCLNRGGGPLVTVGGRSSQLDLRFAQMLLHTARNAYSALLQVPGWEFLKSSQCIKKAKRLRALQRQSMLIFGMQNQWLKN